VRQGWWALMGLMGCAAEEPIVLQLSVSPPSVELDPRDYRTRPAEGTFALYNENEFEIFVTKVGFEGDHADVLTTTPLSDAPVAAGRNTVVRVSYLPTATLWQDGGFVARLLLDVGYFLPGEDSGSGPAATRRRLHPELWVSQRHTVQIAFSWDCDVDGDGVIADSCGGQDCHDQNAAIGPGFDEVCDRADNDCNGAVDDDPVNGTTWYLDADGDGWGDSETAVVACRPPSEQWVNTGGDCDDGQASVSPVGYEFCDELDNDCDGEVDDDCR